LACAKIWRPSALGTIRSTNNLNGEYGAKISITFRASIPGRRLQIRRICAGHYDVLSAVSLLEAGFWLEALAAEDMIAFLPSPLSRVGCSCRHIMTRGYIPHSRT
jgi:hypothetical protein